MVTPGEREPTVCLEPTAAGKTDVGRKRDHNEDQVLVCDDHGLFAVADGMGGHDAGDVASAITAESLLGYFAAPPPEAEPLEGFDDHPGGARRLASSILHANRQVYGKSGRSANQGGMGSTVVAIYVSREEQKVHIGHVGDSRCYRFRDGTLEQLTLDHSMINEALKLNPDLSEDILKQLPSNVVTRALGTKESVEPDLRTEPMVAGDLYLLCSDGLTGEVSDEELQFALDGQDDIEDTCELLVAMANEAGGRDNVSALLVRIDGPDGPVAQAAPFDEPLLLDEDDDLPPPPPPRDEMPTVDHTGVAMDEDGESLPPPLPTAEPLAAQAEAPGEDEDDLPPPPPVDVLSVAIEEVGGELEHDEDDLPPPPLADDDGEPLPLTKPSRPPIGRDATRAAAEAALDEAVDLALAEVDFDVADLDLDEAELAEAGLTGERGTGVLMDERSKPSKPSRESVSAMPIVEVGQPEGTQDAPSEPPAIRCAECGHKLTAEELFCGMCGTIVEREEPGPDVAVCDRCGHEILLGTDFCVECGAKHAYGED